MHIKYLLAVWMLIASSASAMEKNTDTAAMSILEGNTYTANTSDTFTLIVHHNYSLSAVDLMEDTVLTFVSRNGSFRFALPQRQEPVYVTLKCSAYKFVWFNSTFDKTLLSEYMMQPGDSVYVRFNQESVFFSGKGGKRMQIWRDVIKTAERLSYTLPRTEFLSTLPVVRQWFANQDSTLRSKLDVLEQAKDQLSVNEYRLMKADIKGSSLLPIFRSFRLSQFAAYNDTIHRWELAEYDRIFRHYQEPEDLLAIAPQSGLYTAYLYQKLEVDELYESIMKGKKNHDFQKAGEGYLEKIRGAYTGLLRDKLITLWILKRQTRSGSLEKDLSAALDILKDPGCRETVTQIRNTFKKGSPVMDFAFIDRDNNTVQLSSFKGKVVLLDFWFTGCTGCVSVAKTLPAVEAAFHDQDDVVFLSVSIDEDKKKWLQSIADTGAMYGNTGIRYTHYTTKETVYLNTGGSGSANDFIRRYVPTNIYPTLLLLDKDQRVYSAAPPRPDAKDGQQRLIAFIREALADRK